MSRDAAGPVGIPWYRRRDYERILAIMTDAGHLPRSYESWRYKAETLEQRLRENGHQAVRAVIDPKDFARWCAANRLKANAQARLLYVDQGRDGGRGADASV